MPAMDLPNELIFEILSWLPPKTLVSLQSVCKLWFSTISDVKFIQLHQSHFSATGNSHIVIPTIASESGRCPSRPFWLKFSIYLDNNDLTQTNPVKMELVDNVTSDQCWTILGSCNGIICCANVWLDFSLTLLCNPCTGTMIRVPSCPFIRNYGGIPYWSITCGIGFSIGCDQINNYRVLQMRSHDSFRIGEAAVYSLTSKSWKRVKAPNPDLIPLGPSIFLNGFIHWLSFPMDTSLATRKRILVFDVTNEVFSEMQLPEIPKKPTQATSITTVKGLLCVKTVSRGTFLGCDVWMMNEYGVTESWMKLYEVQVSREVFRAMDVTIGGRMIMLCEHGWVARDGKLVFENDDNRSASMNVVYGGGQLVLYDPKTEKYSNVCRTSSDAEYVIIEPTLELLNHAKDLGYKRS